MSNTLDKKAKELNLHYNKFSDNLADIIIDALAGDPKALDRPEVKALGAGNIKAALDWIAAAGINGDYKGLLLNEGWRLTYKRKPPTPAEFLTPEWIGAQAEGIWPNVREAFLNYMDPNPLNPKRGLALSCSIGWGKSLLSNLCVAYDMLHFCFMREPYRILGHSQPVYEKVKLVDGDYITIEDLQIGQKIAGVTQEQSEVLDIIEQGQKDTYELSFENGKSCRCSPDHLWTVFDTQNSKYVVLKTIDIFKDMSRYLFPEKEDCIKDRELILQAERELN